MKNRYTNRGIIIGLIIIGSYFIYLIQINESKMNKKQLVKSGVNHTKTTNQEENIYVKDNIVCKFYDKKNFYLSVKDNKVKELDGEIKGGVVPHHLLAGSIIGDLFITLSQSKPDIIVILGPNHYDRGNRKVCTTSSYWQTPFGILPSHADTIDHLLKKTMVEEDKDILENDHAISSLIPFIKYYMPNTKVVPLLLKGSMTMYESQILSNDLESLLEDENYILVSSVDFSHYLFPVESDKRDEVTLNAIRNWDIKQIRDMNNEFLDSVPSLITLLNHMKNKEAINIELLKHTNAAKILKRNTSDNTSYFTLVYYR